ncbi:MAG: gamma-glutamyltransferase [Betaproteobacteria bacterium]|nr:gamma-glutamyltransferase [Betaproteobacteria bacterium]
MPDQVSASPRTWIIQALSGWHGRAYKWRRACTLVLTCIAFTAAAAELPSRAAIASAHPLATEAGYRVLEQGGNAFDAAVTIAAVLAVVEPYSAGLGGGGFWLLHRAVDRKQVMVDAREMAPAGIALSQYVDEQGVPVPNATLRGGKAAGIPGVPAGMVHLAQRYGKLKLRVLLAPAIALARDGFNIDSRFANVARVRQALLRDGINTARIFLDNGNPPAQGYLLRQPELAATLEALAEHGRDGFYRGAVGQSLVSAVNAAGGVWRAADLTNYKIIERPPVRFSYRGATIVSAALPSSGGITLAQTLNILEDYRIADARDPASAHVVIEALRRGFQDRLRYLGDTDFVVVPIGRLVDKKYAHSRAASINPDFATPFDTLMGSPLAAAKPESYNTTHYSVIDADGNRVGATLSINAWFGGGVVAGNTGVLLNNEIDDFSLGPNLPNIYRLLGSKANEMAPHKRPLSSMSPTFVEDDKGVLVIGAPGGSRIISMVLFGILDYLSQTKVDLLKILTAPRYHHQCWPDVVEIEPDSFSDSWRASLEAKGHTLKPANRKWGNMQAAFKSKTGEAQAASDPRGFDMGGY